MRRLPCPFEQVRFQAVNAPLLRLEIQGGGEVERQLVRTALAGELPGDGKLSTLCNLRDQAYEALAEAGYLADVRIPEQTLSDGVLKLQLVVGRLVYLSVRGELGPVRGLVTRYLEPLQSSTPFKLSLAEKQLQLLNSIPGYEASLSLRPLENGDEGELIGVVSISFKKVESSFNINNLTTSSVPLAISRTEIRNIFGWNDAADVALFADSVGEQRGYLIGYRLTDARSLITVRSRIGGAKYRPQFDDIGPGGLEATSLFASLEVQAPVATFKRGSLLGTIGFEYLNQKVNFLLPLTEDHLRIAVVRGDFSFSGKPDIASSAASRSAAWTFTGSLELRQGLGILGASKKCEESSCLNEHAPLSRIAADPKATVIRLKALADVNISRKSRLKMMSIFQHSFKPLSALEEFQSSNYTIGRGYPLGYVLGDGVVGGQLELVYGTQRAPSKKEVFIDGFAFADAARAYNFDASDPVLLSAGVGARLALGDKLRLELSIARALKATSLLGRPGPRILASLTTRVPPW